MTFIEITYLLIDRIGATASPHSLVKWQETAQILSHAVTKIQPANT